MTIYFYYTRETYGAFGNWSPHGFELDGDYWPTIEHCFQAQKYLTRNYIDQVRNAPTPRIAKELGNRPDWPLRADWEEIKDEVMLRCVLAKMQAHEDVRALLLSTGDEDLVENSKSDYYWGCGADGSGRNQLGKTLMAVRAILRGESAGDG